MDSYDYVMKALGARPQESLAEVLGRTPLSTNRERNRAVRVLRSCDGQPGDVQARKIDKAAALLGASARKAGGS